jgi:Branched-chain amino acid transport protein (AzlD)
MSATELWPYVALIVAGFLPNEIWRWLGLLAARGLEEDSQILVWVRAVATAVLAGVIAQLISTSSGVLATIPLTVRIAAALAGFIAFLLVRRSVLAGVVVGELVLLLSPFVLG